MKKANEKIEGAGLEVVQSSLAVRTMAKNLVSRSTSVVAAAEDGGIYGGKPPMELRSGKLAKPTELSDRKRQKCPSPNESNSMLRSEQKGVNEQNKRRCLDAGKIDEEKEIEKEKEEKSVPENGKMNKEEEENEENRNGHENGFPGDKVLLEFDGKERRTMENTPYNLTADAVNVKTPGSSPKHPCSSEAGSGEQKSILSDIPTEQRIEKFLKDEQKKCLQRFIEKYNFDFVNERPLPGRYEWKKCP